jgi:hypothetical protein
MERTENDRTVFRPSHKTLKIDETDFHIPTATTTTEQSFHSKPEKPVQTNGAAASIVPSVWIEFWRETMQQWSDCCSVAVCGARKP